MKCVDLIYVSSSHLTFLYFQHFNFHRIGFEENIRDEKLLLLPRATINS